MLTFRSISSLTSLGTLALFLGGCPVWGPGPDRPMSEGGMSSDASPDATPQGCMRNSECPAGLICNADSGRCVPAPRTCTMTTDCPAGSYCDERGTCAPGCSTTADCSSQGTGLVCNPTTRRCEAGGGCTTAMDCARNEACVAGRCRVTTEVCQFNFQCSAGQECVDGRCLARCSAASPCPSGQVCNSGRCENMPSPNCGLCPEGQACIAGACSTVCTTDMQCGAGRFCDDGACRVDDRRPPPFCPTNACGPNSTCVDGVCRISCARTGMLSECQMVDGTTSVCDTGRVCRFPSEVSPQCARTADCSMGRTCVDARCQ
ncbi:MAG: hypothetical protein Q8Q09_01035 [Deltaproteobacteria bacterium]|nr:hypothetical protein [Deltaproteobacteria bacterium]